MEQDVLTYSHGAVIRARRNHKRMALLFTGGSYGEGFSTVLDTLENHGIAGSFYLTGDFLREESNHDSIRRAIREGHVLGPHSDKHLLYCPWDDREKTLVTREEFTDDLVANTRLLEDFGVSAEAMRWWIPPYEWYNREIARWSLDAGHPMFCYTPGTLSHADYTEDQAPNFRSNEVIWNSIIDFEAREPDGLNGFLMLIHVGAGPRRTEKFFNRLDDLINHLKSRGYTFGTVPELLEDGI